MINGSSTQITYIIPMEIGMNQKSVSLFSGFSEEFIEKSYFLSLVSKLPQDISELSSASYRNIAVRQGFGDYKLLVVNSAVLSSIPKQSITPFVCIFTSKQTHQKSKDFITSLPFNPIHVSEIRTDKSIYPNELTRKRMRKEFNSVAKQLSGHIDKEDQRSLNKLLSGRPNTLRSSEFTLNSRIHNIVRPSECALVAHRYKFKKSVYLMAGDKEPYIQGVIDASRAILKVRKMIESRCSKSKNDFILALPSFYAFFYKDKSFTNELYTAAGKIARKFFEKHLLRYTGYAASNVTQEEFLEGSNNRYIQSLIQMRQKELFAFTDVMAVLSSEDFAPFIRLPNGLNLLHSNLDTIESLICGVAKRRNEKLNREFSRLNELMLRVVPDDVLKLISDCGEKGIVVSDYPIEWMCLDNDLPLLFTKELCRIGSNPGNVLSELVCNTEHVEFEVSCVRKILVLRSFDDDDPIRNSLEDAVQVFSKNFTNNTEVVFVDVNSEEELCNAS